MLEANVVDERAVFLNVPYDRGYERLFVALLAVLLALGRKPRCTLELPDLGQGRPDRILDLLSGSRVSFHDLSRVGTPARFNMPFELGLAYALRELRGQHDIIIFESKAYRLDRTLSDLKKTDHLVHEGKVSLVISCVLDALGESGGDPDPRRVAVLQRRLMLAARQITRTYRRTSVYHAAVYRTLCAAGIELAKGLGFSSR